MTNERREAVSITLPRRLLKRAMDGTTANRSRRLAQLIQRGLEAEGRVSRPSVEELEAQVRDLAGRLQEIVHELREAPAGAAAKAADDEHRRRSRRGLDQESGRHVEGSVADPGPTSPDSSPDPSPRKNVNEDPFDKYPWARRLKEVVLPDGTREYVPVGPPPDEGNPTEWKECTAKSAKELL